MMMYHFKYCIVRFIPYPAREEFVNVGIVAHCPKTGHFNFKLTKNTKRIESFFSDFDIAIFHDGMEWYAAKLMHIKNMIDHMDLKTKKQEVSSQLFNQFIMPRTTMISCSGMKVIRSPEESIIKVMDKLCNDYVIV